MFRTAPYRQVLRLLCLLSLTRGGLKLDMHDKLRRMFLHCYGFEHALTFYKLEQMGLYNVRPETLTDRDKARSYATLKSTFHLIPTASDPDPKFSFFFNFAPASAYVIMSCSVFLDQSHKGSTMKAGAPTKAASAVVASPAANHQDGGPIVLIYFLGGVTSAELSCLRHVAKTKSCSLVFATTHLLNGSDFVQLALSDSL
jgi:hypothetical protein